MNSGPLWEGRLQGLLVSWPLAWQMRWYVRPTNSVTLLPNGSVLLWRSRIDIRRIAACYVLRPELRNFLVGCGCELPGPQEGKKSWCMQPKAECWDLELRTRGKWGAVCPVTMRHLQTGVGPSKRNWEQIWVWVSKGDIEMS